MALQQDTDTRTQVNIEQGKKVPHSNKRHQQELLHEKLNYLNTQKRQQIKLN